MAATAPSTASDPVTASVPSSAASTNPPKAPFHRPVHPPLFLGRPINPNNPQSHLIGTGIGPPVGPARAFQHRAAAGDRVVTVANPAGYIRNSNPTSVMSVQAQPQAPSRPYMYAAGGEAQGHVQQQQQQQHPAPPASGTHQMRPPHPQHHQFAVPRQQLQQQLGHGGTPRNAPVAAPAAAAAHPKVAPSPTVSSAHENNSIDRDKSREDTVMVIHDRKVRLSEGSSGSLYALCRSWVRNGLPQESQQKIGENMKLLPKPLPASVVNSHILKKNANANDEENSDKDEDLGSVEQLSTRDLLAGHIRRAKKVRSRLRKERLLRIERYKQRLSLLLPTQIELGRNEATPGR